MNIYEDKVKLSHDKFSSNSLALNYSYRLGTDFEDPFSSST